MRLNDIYITANTISNKFISLKTYNDSFFIYRDSIYGDTCWLVSHCDTITISATKYPKILIDGCNGNFII